MWFSFLILAIIIWIKSIFSAADTAFTYLNKAKFSQMSKKNFRAEKIKQLLDNKTRFYGVVRSGATMCELLASAIAAEAFVATIVAEFNIFNLEKGTMYILAIILVAAVLSYFSLVFGELIPKRIAKNQPEKTAYRTLGFLYVISKINYPFEQLLKYSEKFFSKILGIGDEKKEKLTEQEIKMIIAEGKDQGMYDQNEKRLLVNALKFNNKKVKDAMTSKEKIDFININNTYKEIMENIKKYKYTRIPVFEKNKNNVIGILNIKDIVIETVDKNKIKEILRETFIVNKEEKLDKVFNLMKMNKRHLAIVKDDIGNVEGMITLEDIMEELVGEIIDEFDK